MIATDSQIQKIGEEIMISKQILSILYSVNLWLSIFNLSMCGFKKN